MSVKLKIALLVFIIAVSIGIASFTTFRIIQDKAILGAATIRQTTQVSLSPDQPAAPMSIEATKLPRFVYNLTEHKFDSIINAAADKVSSLVQAKIIHTVYAKESLDATVSVEKE